MTELNIAVDQAVGRKKKSNLHSLTGRFTKVLHLTEALEMNFKKVYRISPAFSVAIPAASSRPDNGQNLRVMP